jgi:hypothetical protein
MGILPLLWQENKGGGVMKEAFEKIKEKLEVEVEYQSSKADKAGETCAFEEITVVKAREKIAECYEHAIEIVNQVAEEYGKDANVSTNIIGELKEFLREKKEYNSEQADIWRGSSYTNSHSREMTVLYIDRANAFGSVLREIKVLENKYGNDGWIPCSERLPEEYTEVLAYGREGYTYIALMYDTKIYGKVWRQWNGGEMKLDWIIAWQPLPAPYQPKGEEV